MKLNINDEVALNVKTAFGVAPLTLKVIVVLKNHNYILLAQDRIVRGQRKVDKSWILSEPLDLLNLVPIPDVYHNPIIGEPS